MAIFSPVLVPSDRFATAARPAVLYVRMRGRNTLQSPIEIKADRIVFDNLLFGPWHRSGLADGVDGIMILYGLARRG